MIETHTRILGIAPYDGMRTAMEQAAQAYPNVEMDIYTGDKTRRDGKSRCVHGPREH